MWPAYGGELGHWWGQAVILIVKLLFYLTLKLLDEMLVKKLTMLTHKISLVVSHLERGRVCSAFSFPHFFLIEKRLALTCLLCYLLGF